MLSKLIATQLFKYNDEKRFFRNDANICQIDENILEYIRISSLGKWSNAKRQLISRSFSVFVAFTRMWNWNADRNSREIGQLVCRSTSTWLTVLFLRCSFFSLLHAPTRAGTMFIPCYNRRTFVTWTNWSLIN